MECHEARDCFPCEAITNRCFDKLQAKQCMDFSPDTIVGTEQYQGRLIVFCKHSIWEIGENSDGDGLQRKLLEIK